MILQKDDWELTLKEMKSQRVQNELQRAFLDAGIARCREEIAKFQKK